MPNTSHSITSDLQKLATGSALAFGGAVLGNGLTYLFGLIMGRFLGAETVGLYFLALVLMQLASSLCRFGLPDALLRFVAIRVGEGNLSKLKGSILFSIAVTAAASIAVSALLFVFAGSLSTDVFKQPELAPYVRWIAATLPFVAVMILLLNATQALKRMDLVVLSRDFIQPITMIVAGLVFFYFMRGPASFLAAYFGSMVLAFGTSIYFLVRACPALGSSTSATFDGWKVLLAFSLPIAGADVLHYLFRWSDTLLLSFLSSPSEVGVYNAALRTTLLLNLLAASVNSLYAPIIADHHHHGRHREIEVILKTLVRWCLTLALPLVFTMGVLSEEILSLWGTDFVAGSTALKVLAASQLIFITSNLFAFTLLMCGRQYLELGNVAFVAFVNIAVNLIMIPRYGVTGAALSMLLSQAIGFFLRLVELRSVLGLRLYTSTYLKPLAALAPVSLLTATLYETLIKSVPVLAGGNIGAMLAVGLLIATSYFGVLYLLGIEKEDLLIWSEVRLRRI
jgi:O-antigen/teichoic acid export membrane protein